MLTDSVPVYATYPKKHGDPFIHTYIQTFTILLLYTTRDGRRLCFEIVRVFEKVLQNWAMDIILSGALNCSVCLIDY